jgi:hypothetical protein
MLLNHGHLPKLVVVVISPQTMKTKVCTISIHLSVSLGNKFSTLFFFHVFRYGRKTVNNQSINDICTLLCQTKLQIKFKFGLNPLIFHEGPLTHE